MRGLALLLSVLSVAAAVTLVAAILWGFHTLFTWLATWVEAEYLMPLVPFIIFGVVAVSWAYVWWNRFLLNRAQARWDSQHEQSVGAR